MSSNALELLGVDSAQVVPVSSRSALQAKLDAGSAGAVGPVCTMFGADGMGIVEGEPDEHC